MITNLFVSFLIWYLAAAFLNADLNCKNWGSDERGAVLVFTTLGALVLTMIRFTPQTIAWL